MSPRVARLIIQNFRGIPREVAIDFRPRPGAEPASLVIYGDNGSGKSSIADGLEFLLRASMLRTLDPERPTKRHAESFATESRPYVEAEYGDGSRIARGAPAAGRFKGGVRKVHAPEAGFALAPIVLRRADILGLWSLPAAERKLVFFDYFRSSTPEDQQRLDAAKSVDVLQETILRLRREQSAARRRLGQFTKLDPRKLPSDPRRLQTFRRSELVPNFTIEQKVGKNKTRRALRPDIAQAYNDLFSIVQELNRAERSLRLGSERSGGVSAKKVTSEVQDILADAASFLTESFRAISTSAGFVDRIELDSSPDSNRLAVGLRLVDGRSVDPTALLSEANLDLLSLLLFCAIAEASAQHGQAKLLVFDDVFQSVDAVYRELACRYLVERFRDWQLVFTTHDRLWFAVLTETLRGGGVPFLPREIVRWTFEEGPVIRDATLDPAAGLRRSIAAADPVATCSSAGLLLEEIADRMSWTLGTSVLRRRGDRYTLADLWPGVAKRLKRTDAAQVTAKVTDSAMLRNLVGAHFNEWARALSVAEATRFGESVLALMAHVRCDECQQWLQPGLPGADRWACRCGQCALATA